MIEKYSEWISKNNASLPEGYETYDNKLWFQGIPLMGLVQSYGTPLKLTYLPKIKSQIIKARSVFFDVSNANDFKGDYHYAYCLKSNPMAFVVKEALKQNVNLEISSVFDAKIVLQLFKDGLLEAGRMVICNGYKTDDYLKAIQALMTSGLKRVIPVIDSMDELLEYGTWNFSVSVGFRMTTNETSESAKKTSRFGHFPKEIRIAAGLITKTYPNIRFEMLHFYLFSGINNNDHFWNAYESLISLFSELKKSNPSLKYLNIGGGFPIPTRLGFKFDYKSIVNKIIKQLIVKCDAEGMDHPDIITEFGTYTVGESYAGIFKILESKEQAEDETWYLFDGSVMNAIPDTWAMKKQFLVLPLNHWDKSYKKVALAGLTCDNVDYYDGENELVLPELENAEPLYIGFFGIGAYQEMLGGYKGINHCLIPNPKHIIVDRDENGNLLISEFSEEQSSQEVLNILGY